MSKERAHRAWRNAERIKRLSDKLISIGPFGIGLDGVLAWVPGANLVYSVAAGGLLVAEGFAAGASPVTLARMGVYLVADSVTSEVPFIGWAVDTLFPGHLLAAKALQKDIEARHGPSMLEPLWRGRTKEPDGHLVPPPLGEVDRASRARRRGLKPTSARAL